MCTQWSRVRHNSPAEHRDAITSVLKVFVGNVILVNGTVRLYSNVGEAKSFSLESGIAARSRTSISIALQATL